MSSSELPRPAGEGALTAPAALGLESPTTARFLPLREVADPLERLCPRAFAMRTSYQSSIGGRLPRPVSIPHPATSPRPALAYLSIMLLFTFLIQIALAALAAVLARGLSAAPASRVIHG